MEKMEDRKKWIIITVSFLSLVTLFRMLYINLIPISADEAYFWEWSRHPAMCYQDMPPMIAYFIALFTVFGSSVFTIRLTGVILMLLISILVFMITGRISASSKTAAFTVIILNTLPFIAVISVMLGTDIVLILPWTLSLYLLYLSLFKGNNVYWYLSGAALGFALLSKYVAVIIIISLFVYLVISKQKRYLLGKKEPYIMLAICFAMMIPVIIWNASNEWSNFSFNLFSGRFRSPEVTIKIKFFLEYILGQMLFVSPLFFIGFVWAVVKAVKSRNEVFLFLSVMSLTILSFFGVWSFFDRTGPQWPIPGYISGVILFCVVIFREMENKAGKKKLSVFLTLLIAGNVIFSAAIYGIPLIPKLIPDFELIKNASTKRIAWFLAGWHKDLGKSVSSVRAGMGRKNNTFVICRGFALSSYMAFHMEGQPEVYCIGQRRGVGGEAYRFWQDFKEVIGQDAVFVEEHREKGYIYQISPAFEKVEKDRVFVYEYDGEPIVKTDIWRCYGFKGFKEPQN